MLTISRLRLKLPAAYRDRTALIARLVAKELGALTWEGSLRVERLSLPPITIQPGWSDRQLASKIAAAVQGQVNNLPR
ncbi:MAG: hypothetical protein ACOZFS_04930 [Thermodesulfobacteriota bacterium]